MAWALTLGEILLSFGMFATAVDEIWNTKFLSRNQAA
jgi:hypothetical protein